ncbi:glycoside hydrolase family 6 protein [Nocardioides houyundeii]|uniref:glycoside hydrolase family 6 protein n=1 Tax=Nocardioides houyundeii TaxID=2045452 RepID=UPI001315849E|nr:glycoside hydrolase family 6 protein [Nocardioides houyundeii]
MRHRTGVLVLVALIAAGLGLGTPVHGEVSRAVAVHGAATPGEISQTAQRAHRANPRNPLAGRVWGVYQGPQDQVWAPYQAATGKAKRLIGKIALRPRTKWYGAFVPDEQIGSRVADYIASSQQGDPQALVQLAVFRMQPWEQDACSRSATDQERRSYRTWIKNLAAGIGSTPTLVVMQPDGPFLWCVPRPRATARQLRFATRTLAALPNTSVYIDAGAADWCENGKGNDPERCAEILERTGIEFARGFALDSTHYTGPAENIRHGAEIAAVLRRHGYGRKHFIVDTAKSGRPTAWEDVVPAAKGDEKDNARTCRTRRQKRCVTLGVPPTAQAWHRGWGLSPDVRALAARHVDGFVWFGRPWLYNQADPFVQKRALSMARSTRWPGPGN